MAAAVGGSWNIMCPSLPSLDGASWWAAHDPDGAGPLIGNLSTGNDA